MTVSTLSRKENLRKQALKFLQQHKTAALGTVSSDGAPHVAIVTCIIDDDFNLYFVTKQDSRKFKNILKDPRVAITVGGGSGVPSTIQMEGNAEVIDDPEHFMVSYLSWEKNVADAQWWPLLKMRGVNYAFLKVTIEWARWLNPAISGDTGIHDQGFQEIIARDLHART